MRATQTLPAGYRPAASLDLGQARPLIGLNLVGLVVLGAGGWLMVRLAFALRSDLLPPDLTLGFADLLILILSALIASLFTLVLHEAVHGLFFWLFTGQRPEVGLRGPFAFAAAPSWYLPRDQFAVVGLAPLALITPLGLGLALAAPGPAAWVALLVAIFNTAGAVGDLAVVTWLLWQPRGALVNDQGERFTIYSPATEPFSNS